MIRSKNDDKKGRVGWRTVTGMLVVAAFGCYFSSFFLLIRTQSRQHAAESEKISMLSNPPRRTKETQHQPPKNQTQQTFAGTTSFTASDTHKRQKSSGTVPFEKKSPEKSPTIASTTNSTLSSTDRMYDIRAGNA